jgi:hypothetical protein
MKDFFIVIAEHDTGHGPASSPIYISEKIEKALVAARSAETIGYQFYSSDSCVVIYRTKEDEMVTKPAAAMNVVFIRRFNKNKGGFWTEEWVNKRFMPKEEEIEAA